MNWQDAAVILLVAASLAWLGRFALWSGCPGCGKRRAQKEPRRLIEISAPRKGGRDA
jgi:hypothetical protein